MSLLKLQANNVFSNRSLITCHKTQRRLFSTSKGDLASLSSYDSLFTILPTHSFSISLLTWALEW